MKCIVLAGGGGLRLWPLSRKGYPKQFLKLGGSRTMFADSVFRNQIFCDEFMVITNDSYRFIAEKEINSLEINNYQILLESIGRNTAPAITIAAMLSDPEDILFVVPADAQIHDEIKYKEALENAEALAHEGNIVTFGIKPTSAHTGYGYIKYNANNVLSFKEKPDHDTANKYLDSGDYLWNSGMFMFKSCVFLDELKKYRGDIFDSCQQLVSKIKRDKIINLVKEDMIRIPSESVDYAVMEKSQKMKVVPSDFYWNDVGGLEALCDMLSKDENDNSLIGDNTIINNCKNVSVINDTVNKIVVANDISDLIITNTSNAIYVTAKGSSQKIKDIINEHQESKGEFFNDDIKIYRPWGFYEVVVSRENYKVKRITVYPGKRLSLQKHKFRSEHWTIVSGTAEVTIGEKIMECTANQSTYIPIGERHRLANKGYDNLEVIEVSLGSILSEDDIIRFDDDFGR
ncbi:MAG TPA: mannose-1-phosphate guanylyltransferase/mannose-6-phosphate isomerase [Lachnospiraceae bacterium]|nr:mannose-1-phosphate guanylyltransferase/mannose-6-phosphate isomerase [Lachnospiraceae bacterium]